MNQQNFKKHKQAQDAARAVLDQLPKFITQQSTEASIAQTATKLLLLQGVTDTWYYGVHAFVLLGSRSCLSISGREYKPATEAVGSNNLVTIDLSPQVSGCWGDYARSFVIENGACVRDPKSKNFKSGMLAQKTLHNKMASFVNSQTTFEALFEFGNGLIKDLGFENLDFLGNLGHSIVANKDDRIYIEKGNHTKLSEVNFFTFEPHIKQSNGLYGFKHENIYYFDDNNQLQVL